MEQTQSDQQPTQANTIEAKIQSQFNEEKWTRVSAKDIGISRFKILEGLLEEINQENKVEDLKQMALENLEEYESSVSSRYFLGMLALQNNTPEDFRYLTQLLDKFQENTKWAVVDYLSEKMLETTENRTILRARAQALEKLGKGKEAIPVLEKLARLDRKNPEVALQYAEAVAEEDIDKAIQFYKQAAEMFAKNLQFDRLKIVWNKLVELIPEDTNFLKKIERILSGHRQKEIIAELYVQLTHHFIRQEDTEKIIELSKKVLEYNPNYVRFKNELIKAYKEKYKDNSLLEQFLNFSGLLNAKRNILSSIQNFETNIVFDQGNHVFHRSWNVGRIVELNTENVIVDFKEKPGHKMDLQMALKSLKPLREDHIWVYLHERPEELKKLFDEDIVEFFKILLKSFGNTLALSDIKAEVADNFVPLKSWSKWWTKTRSIILSDSLIAVSPKKKDIIELHEQSVSASDNMIEKFQAASGFDERIDVLNTVLKDATSKDVTEALEYMTPFLKESMKSINLADKIQSLWAMESIQEQLGDDESYFSASQKEGVVNESAALSISEAAKVSQAFKYQDLKRFFAKLIKESNDKWPAIYGEMLLETPIKIHKELIKELLSEAPEAFEDFLNKLKKQAKENTEVLFWMVKNSLSGSIEINNETMKEFTLNVFRQLRNLIKIEPKGTKLKNAAKDLLLGASQGEFIGFIKSSATDSVRKMNSLVKDVSFLSESEKGQISQWLINVSPEAFSEEEQIESPKDQREFLKEIEGKGQILASVNAIEQMKKDLDYLLSEDIPANSEEIGVAQEKGDLRENSEYKAALERQSMLQAQATKLESDIKNAVVISASEVPKDSISVGSKVKLKDKDSQDIFVFTIMDQRDADVDKGIISYRSPLGTSLLFAKVGDTCEFESSKEVIEYEVLSLDLAIDGNGQLI